MQDKSLNESGSAATPTSTVMARTPDVDHSHVLIEVAGDVGLLLWRVLRDVLAWAEASVEERGGVFGRGAAATRRAGLDRVALPVDLAVPANVLTELVATPWGTRPLLVAHACLRVARHLRDTGAGGSALAFAQAAAFACPDNAQALLEVGRLLGPARAADALVCLEGAAAAAEEQGEPELCAQIHTELAALAFRRRESRPARAHLLEAARAVRRARRRRGTRTPREREVGS